MHLEQILRNLPLGVGTPYQKTGLKYFNHHFTMDTLETTGLIRSVAFFFATTGKYSIAIT